MSTEVYRFLPLAGLLAGLVVAFALDPTSEHPAWWAIPGGLIAGYAVRYGIQRHANARR
jgi:hypothetical protein